MNTFDTIIDAIRNPNLILDKKYLSQFDITDETANKILDLQNRNNSLDVFQSEQQMWLMNHMKHSGDATFKVIDDLKNSFTDTLKESKNSQSITKIMFALTFLLGFGLIAFAIYFGIQGKNILAITFGSFGMLSIVTLLIQDPPLKIQDSRSNYAQLTVGMLAWFNDIVDKGSMIQLNNQLKNQLLLSTDNINDRLTIVNDLFEGYNNISNNQINNTIKLLKLIDDVAEPGNMKKKKNEKVVDEVKNTQESIQKPE